MHSRIASAHSSLHSLASSSPVRRITLSLALAVASLGLIPGVGVGGEAEESASPSSADADVESRFAAFRQLLTGSTLVGHFTIPGVSTEKGMHEERYEIRSVSKSERGDFWLFVARVKYGDHDLTLPMPLEVKWAGTTPVITLDSVTIPKLGTFDARVVIDGKQYAGTWRHGDVGGHMFGRIETKDDKNSEDQDR